VPGDGLALAVLVGGEIELAGVGEEALQLGDLLPLPPADHVVGLEVVLDVDAEAGPRLSLDRRRHFGGVARQVADVADGGLDEVLAPEEARDRLRLRRGLHDHERPGHRECNLGHRPWAT